MCHLCLNVDGFMRHAQGISYKAQRLMADSRKIKIQLVLNITMGVSHCFQVNTTQSIDRMLLTILTSRHALSASPL
jgi:hypothetical protein